METETGQQTNTGTAPTINTQELENPTPNVSLPEQPGVPSPFGIGQFLSTPNNGQAQQNEINQLQNQSDDLLGSLIGSFTDDSTQGARTLSAEEEAGIPQMQTDLEQMNADAAQMLETVNGLEGDWEASMQAFDELHERLQAILAQSENWATSEDMAGLLEQVEEFGEGVDLLVLRADYDYDGVINALDKCPDTPLNEINNVNSDGCSPSQLNN